MSQIWRRRLSPAMVVACVALAVALGGTSYATVLQVPRNSVGTVQLKNNAVTSTKVRNASLLRADFRSGQIPAGAAGPTGPSDAVARVINGPISMPTTGPFLTLAGRYVLWAKTGVVATTGPAAS